MPRWTFKCLTCGNEETHSFETWYHMASSVHDEGEPRCLLCNEQMHRLPSAPNFTVGGKFTAKNNYGAKND